MAYYLIHSMGGGQAGFEERDRRAAQNFASAAKQAGVQRIIYLGGLSSQSSPVSLHLKSRQETGAVLRKFGPPVTEFRAGIIVGNGKHLIRDHTLSDGTVAGHDLSALGHDTDATYRHRRRTRLPGRRARRAGSTGQIVEIGGASIETYRSMMLTYAQIRGLKRWLLRVPVLTPRLSSYWLNLVTPFPAAITRPLIEGLKTEVVCTSDQAARLFPQIVPMGYRAAVELALSRTGPDKSVRAMMGRNDSHISLRRQGYICDVRQTRINAPAARVFAVLQGLGGKPGWLYANLLWQMRGWLDRCVGGVGMSRGRTGGAQLQAGDCVDFWRVEEVIPEKKFRFTPK